MTAASGGENATASVLRKDVSLHAFLTKLIWLCIAPLVLLACYLAIDHVRQLQNERNQFAVALTNNLAAAIDRDLNSRIGALNILAQSPLLDEASQHGVWYREAQAFRHSFDGHVVLADRELRMLLNTRLPFGSALPPLPRPQGNAAVPTAFATGKPAVGDSFLGPIAKETLIAVAVPAVRSGAIPYVVLATFEARQFQRQLDLIGLPTGWSISLLDGNGQPIARRTPDGTPLESDTAPERHVVVQSAVAPWSVVLDIPANLYRAPLVTAGLTLAIAIVCATMVGVFGGEVAKRRLGQHLRELTDPSFKNNTATGIVEISAVRQLLDAAAAKRDATQLTLHESEQRFRRLFDEAPIALALIRHNGVVLQVNRRFVQSFGYNRDDTPTLSQWRERAYPNPAYRSWVFEKWNAAVAKSILTAQDIEPLELQITCSDASERTNVVSGITVGDNILITYFDVTERNRAERALLATQTDALEAQRAARLAALNLMEDALAARSLAEAANASLSELSLAVEQSSAGIVITSLRDDIDYVNEAFLRNTGYTRDEVIGKNAQFLRSSGAQSEAYDTMWIALTSGATWRGELDVRRKDGSEYSEAVTISPLRKSDGTVAKYVAVRHDITERKRLDAELERYRDDLEDQVRNRTFALEASQKQAMAASQAKSAFLANMSHEIRTPMNAILGLVYLLRQNKPTVEQSERLVKIDDAARHLLSIINDILDLSKIEAGQLALEDVDFSLESLLQNVESMTINQAHAKGLKFETDIDAPLWLRGDPMRLRQAILNYAGNAVKFTADGAVRLYVRLLKETERGLLIRFEVSDTGIGIAHENLGELFKSFAQADVSTTRTYGGTGLGLVITRHLATMMGGEAGVKSVFGTGSTFWFTAWLSRAQDVTSGRPVAATALVNAESVLLNDYAGAKILLVEDDPINTEVALELLTSVGLVVDTAKNGAIAVQRVGIDTYDLVLMDVQMPEMDGLQATRIIRTVPANRSLPILAMTANAFDSNRQECLDAGMNEFVGKPVIPQALYSALVQWLPRRKGVGSSHNTDRVADLSTAELSASKVPPTPQLKRQRPDNRIADVLGLNTAPGLTNVAGSAEKNAKLLRSFAEVHENDMARIRELLAQENRPGAQVVAQTLAGVAAAVGAEIVSKLAMQVSDALRCSETAGRHETTVDACDRQLRLLIADIYKTTRPL